VAGDVAVNRFDVHGDPDPIFFLGYWKNGRHPPQVHRRLVPHRRPGHARRGRLPLVPGPRGRRLQGGRLPHRPQRDRELPGQAPGRGQCGSGAQARRRARRAGEGLRGAGAAGAAGARHHDPRHGEFRRRAGRRTAGAREGQAGALRVSEGDRVHRGAADDHHRQGAAPRAAAAGRGKMSWSRIASQASMPGADRKRSRASSGSHSGDITSAHQS
jgi:hypothetical protein